MTQGPLHGQTAIITGANSGIGYGCAEALAAAGAAVAINYHHHSDAAQALATQINAAGGKAIAVNADTSNEAEVERMFATVVAHYGSVDILINNAGLQKTPSSPRCRLKTGTPR